MAKVETGKPCCERANVAAYLDGELDAAASAFFEGHTKVCASCAVVLAEQRRILCLLDTTLRGASLEKKLTLPKNFAEVVTARAQSDMSGMRRQPEHKCAALLCGLLIAAAFALLGAATLSTAVAPLVAIVHALASVMGMVGNFCADAGASMAVILRAAGGYLTADPDLRRFLTWSIFVSAAALLWRLISSYHRAAARAVE